MPFRIHLKLVSQARLGVQDSLLVEPINFNGYYYVSSIDFILIELRITSLTTIPSLYLFEFMA